MCATPNTHQYYFNLETFQFIDSPGCRHGLMPATHLFISPVLDELRRKKHIRRTAMRFIAARYQVHFILKKAGYFQVSSVRTTAIVCPRFSANLTQNIHYYYSYTWTHRLELVRGMALPVMRGYRMLRVPPGMVVVMLTIHTTRKSKFHNARCLV